MNSDTHTGDELLNARQVGRLLQCSLPLVYKLAERGQIPCVRWECLGEGKQKHRTMLRFKSQDIFEFVERHYQNDKRCHHAK